MAVLQSHGVFIYKTNLTNFLNRDIGPDHASNLVILSLAHFNALAMINDKMACAGSVYPACVCGCACECVNVCVSFLLCWCHHFCHLLINWNK